MEETGEGGTLKTKSEGALQVSSVHRAEHCQVSIFLQMTQLDLVERDKMGETEEIFDEANRRQTGSGGGEGRDGRRKEGIYTREFHKPHSRQSLFSNEGRQPLI